MNNLLQQAKDFFNNGDYSTAHTLLCTFIDDNGNIAEAYYIRANCTFCIWENNDAMPMDIEAILKDLNQAIYINHNYIEARALRWNIIINHARSHYDIALEDANYFLQSDARIETQKYWLPSQAYCFYKTGAYEKAINSYTKLINELNNSNTPRKEKDPDIATYYYQLANIYYDLENKKLAKENINQALLHRSDAAALLKLAGQFCFWRNTFTINN
jgi:tetratricopeptide (TPR) repeat protein